MFWRTGIVVEKTFRKSRWYREDDVDLSNAPIWGTISMIRYNEYWYDWGTSNVILVITRTNEHKSNIKPWWEAGLAPLTSCLWAYMGGIDGSVIMLIAKFDLVIYINLFLPKLHLACFFFQLMCCS